MDILHILRTALGILDAVITSVSGTRLRFYNFSLQLKSLDFKDLQ